MISLGLSIAAAMQVFIPERSIFVEKQVSTAGFDIQMDSEIPIGEHRFILFDSMERKDAHRVLGSSKTSTLKGRELLKEQGVNSVADFIDGEKAPASAATDNRRGDRKE